MHTSCFIAKSEYTLENLYEPYQENIAPLNTYFHIVQYISVFIVNMEIDIQYFLSLSSWRLLATWYWYAINLTVS
jgi:hypothetical protein